MFLRCLRIHLVECREELSTLASRIRDKHADENDDETGEGRTEELMQREFRDEALRIYRDDLGMKEAVLDSIINTISAGFVV